MIPDRRRFLRRAAAASVAGALPLASLSSRASEARRFAPEPGDWRRFTVTTRIDLAPSDAALQVWLPAPSLHTGWQRSVGDDVRTNGITDWHADPRYGARMLRVRFAAGQPEPYVELASQVQTRNRAPDWTQLRRSDETPASLRFWTQPTRLLPTDGIVRATAQRATRGAYTDEAKARQIYEWVVDNTHREPKIRGCGEGDIRTMLETGNLGGKCADLNALFVGLCRAAGLPARDIYGLRLAPSTFGYKELGAAPERLTGAQHCRAEVHLAGRGWVAMDPADVAKVMRQETGEWIRDVSHPVVAPVHRALFGGWEGNWVGWNMAHDLRLPGALGPELGFFMYPMAETATGRLDPYAPDDFRYRITATEG